MGPGWVGCGMQVPLAEPDGERTVPLIREIEEVTCLITLIFDLAGAAFSSDIYILQTIPHAIGGGGSVIGAW